MIANIPQGCVAAAQEKWVLGAQQAAIDLLLAAINAHGAVKPKPLLIQFAYYLSLLGDWAAAARVFADTITQHGPDWQVYKNTAVARNKPGDYAGAIADLLRAQALQPDDFYIQDGLAHAYYHLRQYESATSAGISALTLKDAAARRPATQPTRPAQYAGTDKIIAFSLWGRHPRYLRGALRNALLIDDLYPGWRARFYLDATVPQDFRDTLASLGADLRLMPAEAASGEKLTWRFLVANDPAIDRFLVRDCDSVIGMREAQAVAAWIASGKSFHAMRDWWTHTDLILAGMWGGKAGMLPDLHALWRAYVPGLMPTANVDQWFLRDRVWPLIRDDALVHDRCYRVPGSLPFPSPDPPGEAHVGQDEFAAARARQTSLLVAWIARLPILAA